MIGSKRRLVNEEDELDDELHMASLVLIGRQ
jgi:hypothetical protein